MIFLRTRFWDSAVFAPFWTGAGALWIFSAAVSAMDAPQPKDGGFYRWLYRFTHLLAANLDRVLSSAPLNLPQEQNQTNMKEKN